MYTKITLTLVYCALIHLFRLIGPILFYVEMIMVCYCLLKCILNNVTQCLPAFTPYSDNNITFYIKTFTPLLYTYDINTL